MRPGRSTMVTARGAPSAPMRHHDALVAIEEDPVATVGDRCHRGHQRRAGQHVQRVHVRHEVGHVGVGRIEDDILRLAVLDDAAGLHDRDVAAELHRLVQIVRDEDDGLPELALQIEELVLQAGADQRVEGGERLVHEQDVGVGRERAREADPLLHAARELVGVLVAPLLEPDQLELLGDHLVALGLGHATQLEAEADILGDRAPGQQRELLEHHGDAVGA